MRNKPTLFIGSSGGAKEQVKIFASVLSDSATCVPWFLAEEFKSRGTNTTIDALTEAAFDYDFALLVLTPDDKIEQIRRETKTGSCPRDNVVFETGLFMGTLGAERVFLAQQTCGNLVLPSDLFGATKPSFSFDPDDKITSTASISNVAQGFEDQIRDLGFNQFALLIGDGWGPENSPERFELKLSYANLIKHKRLLRKRRLGIGVRIKNEYVNFEDDEGMVFSETRPYPKEHQDMLFKVELNQLPSRPNDSDRLQAVLLSVPSNVELAKCSTLSDAQAEGCRIIEPYSSNAFRKESN